jgi:LmbE family N-acetylglucosaminyl deacetylase
MRYIFLSPHLDDISLSCGGIVNHLSGNNIKTQIWSIFAGSPIESNLSPFALSLHNRWRLPLNAPKKRRLEDIVACKILGADFRHFNFLDCIYRKDNYGDPIIKEEEDLYQPIPDSQESLIEEISFIFKTHILAEDIVVAPLAIGNHLDHQIIFKSISFLQFRSLLFYEDYPYVIKSQNHQTNTANLLPIQFLLTGENIRNWHDSIAAYKSQISTFWTDIAQMTSDISHYFDIGGGKNLWKS